jgi:hypothetical protein
MSTTRSGLPYQPQPQPQPTAAEQYEIDRAKRMAEYRNWINSLTPDERVYYETNGYLDNNQSGGYKKKAKKSKKRKINTRNKRNTRRKRGRSGRRH